MYQGPHKDRAQLSERIQEALRERPELNVLWRKCKTVLRIETRCNADVWHRLRLPDQIECQMPRRGTTLYADELCRAHIPVVNRLIQSYRLTSYDYFAFEVAPWDIPIWYIERDAQSVRTLLVPYRGWDHRPLIFNVDKKPDFYRLVDGAQNSRANARDGNPW